MKKYISIIKDYIKTVDDPATTEIMNKFEQYVVSINMAKKLVRAKSSHAMFQTAFWAWIKQNQHHPEFLKTKDNNLMKLFSNVWTANTTKSEDKTELTPMLIDLIKKYEAGQSLSDLYINEFKSYRTWVKAPEPTVVQLPSAPVSTSVQTSVPTSVQSPPVPVSIPEPSKSKVKITKKKTDEPVKVKQTRVL